MFLFSAMKSIQDDEQDGSNSWVGNHIVFAVIYSTEKITDFIYRVGNVFLCLCSGNRIHQSMHHFTGHFWPDLIMP